MEVLEPLAIQSTVGAYALSVGLRIVTASVRSQSWRPSLAVYTGMQRRDDRVDTTDTVHIAQRIL
jgi:hypothetical protein